MCNEIMKKEVQEAIAAGEKALRSLYAAEEKLKSAGDWGLFDMLGGGFFSSYIKHSKIRDAEALLERAKEHLLVFQRELKDVGGALNLRIEVGDFLTFADFFWITLWQTIWYRIKLKMPEKILRLEFTM